MSSITFHYEIISSNRRKDGTYPVKIRVTYKGASRRQATNLIARPGDFTRTLHIKNPDIIRRANDLIEKMQDTLRDLSPFMIEDWNVDMVVDHIRREISASTFRLDFFEFGEKHIAKKTENTRKAYLCAMRSFEEFLGRRQIDINSISKSMILDWREFVDRGNKRQVKKGVMTETKRAQGGGQSTRMTDKLAHIYRAAQLQYNDEVRELIPRHPFDGLPRHLPAASGQRSVGADVLQRMIDFPERSRKTRFVLDLFLLSFATMGANLADLWEARDVGKVWHYNRRKTRSRRADHAEMFVHIQPEIETILYRLGANKQGLWLPYLRRFAQDSDHCTGRINRVLKAWAASQDIEPFTFYAARHTWASLARRAGVEKATIDECLCHIGDFPVADIYIERDWELLNAANRRAIALLRWDALGNPVAPSMTE